MPSLKDRVWRVTLAGMTIEALDIEFEIKRTLKTEPNSCSLKIYNLSASHRADIEKLNVYDPKKSKTKGIKAQAKIKSGDITTQVCAGYRETGATQLFLGGLRRGISTWDGRDWVTELEGEDGRIFAVRATKSYPPGTPKLTVVKALIEALGLGTGNLAEVSADLAGSVYAHGTTLDGPAADLLKSILRSNQITYSVQSGGVQFLRVGQGSPQLKVQAYPLSEETGLVGSPRRDATGEVVCKSLLVPDISPGGYVLLKSKAINGLFRVMSVRHTGSTFGNEWHHDMSLLPA